MTDIQKQLADALEDMTAGWKYIRSSHGDLYGVGWDRAQNKADAALAAHRQQEARPTEPGWYVVLPPDFDEPTVRAFGRDGEWWVPLGRGNGVDGWLSGREYKNWVGPIADIDDRQPFWDKPAPDAAHGIKGE